MCEKSSVPAADSNLKKTSAIMVFGPTASGKTGLAIKLAKKLNGVIINADSRQIYQQMPIITAMPSKEEFASAPHRLFDFLAPDKAFSVGDYLQKASAVAEEVVGEGKTPIFCGGTGFYLQVLEKGISPIPTIPQAVVMELNQQFQRDGLAQLYAELQQCDPELAQKLEATDSQRIIRGLAVFRSTNKQLSYFQSKAKQGGLPYNFKKITLEPDREELYQRINQRFENMLDLGLVDEMKALQKQGFTADDIAIKSIGIKEMFAYIDGKMSLQQARENITRQTRRYAKRQYTWLRNQYGGDGKRI